MEKKMSENKHKRQDNIKPDTIPLLSWDSLENQQNAIKVLYDGVQEKYISVIDWYLQRKEQKRTIAQFLRRLSIIMVSIAATGLVVTAICAGDHWAKYLGTVSSSILVLSAGIVAYDRFFGYSTSWIRFILNALTLQKKLSQFQTDINALPLIMKQDQDRILEKTMEIIKDAYVFLYSCMASEAHQWAVEFRGNLDRSVAEQLNDIKTTSSN